MTDDKPVRRSSIFDILRSKQESAMVTVREEKKSLVQAVRARPREIKHISEVLDSKSVVVDSMKSSEGATSARETGAFTCVECGTGMQPGIFVCPRCRAKYLTDIPPEAVAELEEAVASASENEDYENDDADALAFDEFPIIHFDAVDGVISYLEHRDGGSDFELECSSCGTLIQIDIDRCPLCGASLEVMDAGLVNLISNAEFADEAVPEMECPQCGEHVVLQDGRCPACESVILGRGPDEAVGRKIIPLIRNENVVFVHIDMETGDLNYLQRHLKRAAIEHVSIQLEGIDDNGYSEDRRGLSRI